MFAFVGCFQKNILGLIDLDGEIVRSAEVRVKLLDQAPVRLLDLASLRAGLESKDIHRFVFRHQRCSGLAAVAVSISPTVDRSQLLRMRLFQVFLQCRCGSKNNLFGARVGTGVEFPAPPRRFALIQRRAFHITQLLRQVRAEKARISIMHAPSAAALIHCRLTSNTTSRTSAKMAMPIAAQPAVCAMPLGSLLMNQRVRKRRELPGEADRSWCT